MTFLNLSLVEIFCYHLLENLLFTHYRRFFCFALLEQEQRIALHSRSGNHLFEAGLGFVEKTGLFYLQPRRFDRFRECSPNRRFCSMENYCYYIKWSVSQEDIDLCEAMIRRVGMEQFQVRSLDELSGGELQKVMLARALVQQPKLLLLDEPTSNLDPRNQYEMMALVRQIAREQGIAVFIVIHDLNLALRYCDRFYFLKDGTGYRYGGVETVTAETIQTVYGIKAEIAQINGKQVVVLD